MVALFFSPAAKKRRAPPLQSPSEWSEVGREEEYMALSRQERASKLKNLAESEGYEKIDDLLHDAACDSVVSGICTRPDCSYTCECEPDARKNYCEACGHQTVQSCLVLAGLI